MELRTSLDWQAVQTKLKQQISLLDAHYATQANKMLRNFDGMVTKLSQLELEQRRSATHSPRRVNEQLETVNNEIHNFEMWITMLTLSSC
jgi:hypothetical protein